MADRLLEDGPAEYWSAEKPPTPAQYRALALAAAKILDLPAPASRLDATTMLVRLRMADAELPDVRADSGVKGDVKVPDPW